ncbi:hypothetical protein [Shinella curvata]
MKRLALIGLIATLSACNSTDALTPQVDVGGGFNSPPVTQRDLDQMSAQTTPVTTTTQQSAFTTPAETGTTTGAETAGTLQGQAEALTRNSTRTTTDTALARETAQRSLAAETSGGAEEVAVVSPAKSAETIRFLPIIGAPVEAVTPLSKRLGAEARSNGLTIRSASDNSSKYILKGYFSAMNDSGKTTVVYVWDVLDGQGARLHRIQGQESVSDTASDPWSAVPASTMEGIAQKTIRAYLDWRGSVPG